MMLMYRTTPDATFMPHARIGALGLLVGAFVLIPLGKLMITRYPHQPFLWTFAGLVFITVGMNAAWSLFKTLTTNLNRRY